MEPAYGGEEVGWDTYVKISNYVDVSPKWKEPVQTTDSWYYFIGAYGNSANSMALLQINRDVIEKAVSDSQSRGSIQIEYTRFSQVSPLLSVTRLQ